MIGAIAMVSPHIKPSQCCGRTDIRSEDSMFLNERGMLQNTSLSVFRYTIPICGYGLSENAADTGWICKSCLAKLGLIW